MKRIKLQSVLNERKTKWTKNCSKLESERKREAMMDDNNNDNITIYLSTVGGWVKF